jgi:hypothetical protein
MSSDTLTPLTQSNPSSTATVLPDPHQLNVSSSNFPLNNSCSFASTLQSPLTAPISSLTSHSDHHGFSRRASVPNVPGSLGRAKFPSKLGSRANPGVHKTNNGALSGDFLSPTNLEYRSILNELVDAHNFIASPKFLGSTQPITNNRALSPVIHEEGPNLLVKTEEISAEKLENSSNFSEKQVNNDVLPASAVEIESEESSADTLLAARIGQSLLEENQQLNIENAQLKQQLAALQAQIEQNQSENSENPNNSVIFLAEEDQIGSNFDDGGEISVLQQRILDLQQELRNLEIVHLADTRRRIKQIKHNIINDYETKLNSLLLSHNLSKLPSAGTEKPQIDPNLNRKVQFSVELQDLSPDLLSSELSVSSFYKNSADLPYNFIGQTEKRASSSNFVRFQRHFGTESMNCNDNCALRFSLYQTKREKSNNSEEKQQLSTVIVHGRQFLHENYSKSTEKGYSLCSLELELLRTAENGGEIIGKLLISLKVEPELPISPLSIDTEAANQVSEGFSSETSLNSTPGAIPTPKIPDFHLNLASPPYSSGLPADFLGDIAETTRNSTNHEENHIFSQLQQYKLRAASLENEKLNAESCLVSAEAEMARLNHQITAFSSRIQGYLEHSSSSLKNGNCDRGVTGNSQEVLLSGCLENNFQELETMPNNLNNANSGLNGSNIGELKMNEALYDLQPQLMQLCALLGVDLPFSQLVLPQAGQRVYKKLFSLWQFQLNWAILWFFKTNSEQQSSLLQRRNIKLHSFNRSQADFQLNLLEKSSREYELAVLNHSHWQDDRSCANCSNCNAEFNLFRRKHHCRSGEINLNSAVERQIKLADSNFLFFVIIYCLIALDAVV